MVAEGDGELEARAVELRERAAALAKPLHATAMASTTVGRERATLRLLGVDGLDREGRPLAHEVADRFAALGPARLGGGIALPFAAAALEYDLPPEELALEVAAGHVDLGLEADVLRDPERRTAAEALAREWLAGAWRRFAAQRTARGELRALLGERAPTHVGAELDEADAGGAARRATAIVGGGADVVLARVPRDRELRRGLGEQFEVPETSDDPRRAPPGSQRGLAVLRTALDGAAAEAGRYVALASHSLGLAVPDQAVVAGLERIDLVFSDPVEPIVEFGLAPERAFADHAFAVEVHGRGAATLILGPGPLAVAPEMARGQPIAPATQAGRALALQALAVAFTRCGSLPDDRIGIEAPIEAVQGDPTELSAATVEVHLRRLAFPEHRLALRERSGGDPLVWPSVLQACLAGGPPPALVLRAPLAGIAPAEQIGAVASAVVGAASLGLSRELGGLRGPSRERALATLMEALETLRAIAAEGWEWLLRMEGPVSGTADPRIVRRRLAAGAPVPLREALDPLLVDRPATMAGAGAGVVAG